MESCPECGKSGCAGHPTVKKKPYVFDKRTHKAILAAEIVLGPQALTRLLAALLIKCSEYDKVDSDNFYNIRAILELKDPGFQAVIKTDPGVVGGLTIETAPEEVSINDDFQGYTLIDLKTAITEAMRGDITGFMLEMIQLKWGRELTIADAMAVTFHLNKLIQLLQ